MTKTHNSLTGARHHLGLCARQLKSALYQAHKAHATDHHINSIHLALTLNSQTQDIVKRLIAHSHQHAKLPV